MLKRNVSAALMVIGFMGQAHADVLDSIGVMATGLSPSWTIRSLAENSDNAQAALKLQAVIAESPSGAHRAFNAWQNDSEQSRYPRWGEVGLNMLRWVEPGRSYDWKYGVKVRGNAVAYQQDSLVDLDRTQAIQQSFEATTEQGRGYQVQDASRPVHLVPATSARLLSEGLAPIGPDNRPILLCRLGTGSQAPYVEMTQGQRMRLSGATGLEMNNCLTGSLATEYWKSRYSDFVDSYYDRTPRHRPGESQ